MAEIIYNKFLLIIYFLYANIMLNHKEFLILYNIFYKKYFYNLIERIFVLGKNCCKNRRDYWCIKLYSIVNLEKGMNWRE